jgi:ATP-dependent Lon protease
VTGLAWTQAGGDILFIEALFAPGSGKVILTGQLGDVMKESAQVAISLVRHMVPDKAEMFEKNDLHIHVPAGAVPKDGPSAGITLTTALYSLVNDTAVDPTIAMTGEISLDGRVMPIGGLPEKLMAAVRAGVKTVFIPKDNKEDLEDVPEEIQKELTIIPVKNAGQVLKKAVCGN